MTQNENNGCGISGRNVFSCICYPGTSVDGGMPGDVCIVCHGFKGAPMKPKYWRLFVDDIRPIPQGWLGARTVSEAIAILANLPVSEVSLDHDIILPMQPNGQNYQPLLHETFKGVAYYIAAMPRDARPSTIRLHTANAGAAQTMCNIMGISFEGAYALYDRRDYERAETL